MPPRTSSPPLTCLECGTELYYAGLGRRPRYCSQTCRSRACEIRRAAREGKVATKVVERIIEVDAPLDAETVTQWLNGHPHRLSAVIQRLDWSTEQLDGLRCGLRDATHGGTDLSPGFLSRLLDAKAASSELHMPKITNREQIVLSLICEGKTNVEIGESMRLAEVTIRKIISQLFLRFSAKNRVDLAIKYLSIKHSY
ncbi:hypothetical protein GC425_09520 [Corynebacterium sp. zg254]|uniref:Response regulator transcription factor n=2 Tax=Corynebacterium TaxID=1716 RepID=A0ABQ6VBU9_9CORY|nr:LuxR C-terminal-related transcriptional regulator [Corynebacterium sp. zg254]KAB3519224.1 response regulator transcription factor [Corynebacterium zhongnanshanii]MCR5915078.1 hypothetical protein [Corynebacterium sp. zg254]